MNTTQTTLIDRVRDPNDTFAWREFHQLYSSLTYGYARARGLNDTDAMDLASDCMELLSRRMRDFTYDPKACKFRSYLRTIVDNKVINVIRKKRPLQVSTEELDRVRRPEQAPDELWAMQWELNHMLHCWRQIEMQLPPKQADAFRMYVIEELPVKQVAETLGLTANQIYQYKSRIIQRLKQTMSDLLGDD